MPYSVATRTKVFKYKAPSSMPKIPYLDSGALIGNPDDSRSSKLRKIELLASKHYLNGPHSPGRRSQQRYNTHHNDASDVTKSPEQPSRTAGSGEYSSAALIDTSPKRDRRLHHRVRESPTQKVGMIQVIGKPEEHQESYSNHEDNPTSEIKCEETEPESLIHQPNTTAQNQETQEADDLGMLDMVDEDQDDRDEIETSWTKHQDLVDQDFPTLKIASRVSPGDKFFKSLQNEKGKYHKIAKTKLLNDPLMEQAPIVRKSGTRGDAAKEKQISPKRNGLLKSLESTRADAKAIEELTNSPRSLRARKNQADDLAIPQQSLEAKPVSVKEPIAELKAKVSPKRKAPTKESKADTSLTHAVTPLAEKINDISLEQKALKMARETSPTPAKRNRKKEPIPNKMKALKKIKLLHREDMKDLMDEPEVDSSFKKVKLLHSEESKKLFEESQPFDSQDFDDFNLLQTSQDTAFESAISSPVKEAPKPAPNRILQQVLREFGDEVPQPKAEEVEHLKEVIMKRIDGQLPPLELHGLEDHYHQIYRMIRNTITNAEGNSCLMMGPSGTGKKTLIKKILFDLEAKFPRQFITVRLSGAVQTDEKLAIRSIAQQIDNAISAYQADTEMKDFKITDARNSNRTLRALLKVLDQNELTDFKSKSIDKNLSVAIVFVIDEFHRFTEYNRQSLLYNLFDLSQNSNTPVSVIGLTTKITTREMLEKRVKSRYSQKIIMFNKPNLVEDFIAQFLQNCTLREEEISNKIYAKVYNAYLVKAATTIDAALHKHLVVNHYTIRSLSESLNSLLIPIAKLSASEPYPEFTFMLMGEDPYSNEIRRKIDSLSDLELSLLLACCRIVVKTELNNVDFNSCYNEYLSAMKSLKADRISSMTNFETGTGVVIDLKIWPKQNTKRAWELLQKIGVIIDTNANNSHGAKKGGQSQSFNSFSVVVTLEELKKCMSKQSGLYHLTNI